MILQTFVAVNSAILATRAINTKIDEEMKDKILDDGLYHVTTAENAEKIMESGHIRPSGIILSGGTKKCFFFAGLPSYRDLSSNCASEATKYEFKAIKLLPNNEELSKFRQRSYNDDSITFKGKCELPEERTQVVDLVLDIDEKGNIYTREKTEEELEKYIPKPELVQKMQELGNNNMFKVMGKAYLREYKTVGQKLAKKIAEIKDRLTNKKLELPGANIKEDEYKCSEKDISQELKNSTYTVEEAYKNDKMFEEKEEQNLHIENKELI